jgi:hypothetical protein
LILRELKARPLSADESADVDKIFRAFAIGRQRLIRDGLGNKRGNICGGEDGVAAVAKITQCEVVEETRDCAAFSIERRRSIRGPM